MSILTSSKFRNHREMIPEESNSLFWGICCESGKKYSQVVCQRFHITMAALEPNAELRESSGDKYVSLMVERAGSEYLLCNLKHDSILQVNLNLLFDEGEDVTFFLKGQGTVHLSGYHLSDSDKKGTNRISSFETVSVGIPTSPKKGTPIPSKKEIPTLPKKGIPTPPKKIIPIPPNKIQIHKSPVAGPSKVKKEEIILEEDSSSSSEDDVEVVSTSLKKEAKKPTKSAKVTTPANDEADDDDDGDDGDDDDDDDDDDDGDDEEEEGEEEINDIAAPEVDIESEEEKPEGAKISSTKKRDIWEIINSMKESSDDSDSSELSEEPTPEMKKSIENQKKKSEKRLIQKQSIEETVTPVKPSVSSPNVPRKSPFTTDKSKKSSDSDKGLLNSSIGRTPMPKKKRLQSSLNDSNSAKKMKMNTSIPQKSDEDTVKVEKPQSSKVIKTKRGDVEMYDIRQGYGPIAKFGKFVHIVFIGRTVDGTVIANSPEEKPLSYKLGSGNVIEGFDAGIKGMCVGGKRKIIVPYAVAYGKRQEPGVPFGSPLTFIVKLTAVS